MHELDPFARAVLDGATANPQFPQAMYDPDGDCLEFVITSENYRGKRLDSLVTVYIGEDTGEVVGVVIKGVKQRLTRAIREKVPGFAVEIRGGKVRLEALFQVLYWTESSSGMERRVYDRIVAAAEKGNVELDSAELCAV
jgi:hypothetical protein